MNTHDFLKVTVFNNPQLQEKIMDPAAEQRNTKDAVKKYCMSFWGSPMLMALFGAIAIGATIPLVIGVIIWSGESICQEDNYGLQSTTIKITQISTDYYNGGLEQYYYGYIVNGAYKVAGTDVSCTFDKRQLRNWLCEKDTLNMTLECMTDTYAVGENLACYATAKDYGNKCAVVLRDCDAGGVQTMEISGICIAGGLVLAGLSWCIHEIERDAARRAPRADENTVLTPAASAPANPNASSGLPGPAGQKQYETFQSNA
jgi:hypothetical protein